MTALKRSRPARAQEEASDKIFRHFGLCLRIFRELAGQSIANLARKAAIGKSQLSKYESGRELPKLTSFAKVLAVLDLSPLTFFYALAALEKYFANRDGFDAAILLQERSTGPLFSAEERAAQRALFDNFLRLMESSVEARVLARRSFGEESGP